MRQLASNAVRSPSTQWRRSIVCSSSCVRECNGVSFNPRLLRTYQSSSILVDGFKQASSRMPTRLSSGSMLAPILPRITLWTQPTSRRQRQEGVPKRGLYTVDTMKHISRLSLDKIQVVGVDPGMIDLINCVDPMRLLTKGATSPPSNVVYTAKRWKHETCSILYHKKMEAEKREMAPGVVVAELEMTRFNKRSTDRSVLMSYFDARREAAQQMDDFYGRIMYRVFPSCDDGNPFRWTSVV